MADSRLTVRTLCLATVALILACGHAHRAMAQQARAAQDRVVPKSTSPIRVVPAGSGKSTVATITNKATGPSRSGGAAKVATFTSKSSSGSGGSVVTFNGDRQTVAHASSSRPKPQAKPSARPSSAASTAKPGRKPSILPEKKDPPIIAVRRPGQHAEQPSDLGEPAKDQTADPSPVSTVAVTRPALRNAFGGLSSNSTVEFTSAPRVYAHAAR